MLGDRQFGVCLIDRSRSLNGWDSPRMVGTIAKILKCEDAKLDGSTLHIETMGRSSFQIQKIIPPDVPQHANYDPHSTKGLQDIYEIHEKLGIQKKMYIRAQVEIIPEIDENISLTQWEKLIELWKKKFIYQALPEIIDSYFLDHVLQHYYLDTVTPTIDYVYSLSALAAMHPEELQPILEATTMDDLIHQVQALMTIK